VLKPRLTLTQANQVQKTQLFTCTQMVTLTPATGSYVTFPQHF